MSLYIVKRPGKPDYPTDDINEARALIEDSGASYIQYSPEAIKQYEAENADAIAAVTGNLTAKTTPVVDLNGREVVKTANTKRDALGSFERPLQWNERLEKNRAA